MSDPQTDLLAYYATAGPMTDPRERAALLAGLPGDLPGLVAALQGVVVHVFWAHRYGLELSEARQAEVQLRPVWRKLERLTELSPAPLDRPRPLEQRLVSNCRDISTLLCAALRARGIPARARCGFATYFLPGHYEDHWACEVWRADEGRWVMLDAQLDGLQRKALSIDFDPLDVPAGRFITGGQAWRMCRDGQADPDHFGIFEWHGWDFVRGNVFRDLLSLNKVEVLPWDTWDALEPAVADCTTQQLEQIDRVAGWAAAGDALAARAAYAGTPQYQIPPEWAD